MFHLCISPSSASNSEIPYISQYFKGGITSGKLTSVCRDCGIASWMASSSSTISENVGLSSAFWCLSQLVIYSNPNRLFLPALTNQISPTLWTRTRDFRPITRQNPLPNIRNINHIKRNFTAKDWRAVLAFFSEGLVEDFSVSFCFSLFLFMH